MNCIRPNHQKQVVKKQNLEVILYMYCLKIAAMFEQHGVSSMVGDFEKRMSEFTNR